VELEWRKSSGSDIVNRDSDASKLTSAGSGYDGEWFGNERSSSNIATEYDLSNYGGER
jgi:hypothetical protein